MRCVCCCLLLSLKASVVAGGCFFLVFFFFSLFCFSLFGFVFKTGWCEIVNGVWGCVVTCFHRDKWLFLLPAGFEVQVNSVKPFSQNRAPKQSCMRCKFNLFFFFSPVKGTVNNTHEEINL